MVNNFIKILISELEKIKKSNRYRFLREISSKPDKHVTLNNQEVLNLCSNNYLGLASHPEIIKAESEAAKKFGAGSTGSRLITGTTSLHLLLEEKVAQFKKTEKAIIYNSGYMANIGILDALTDDKDVILSDELNHASIVDGCRISKANVKIYKHKDLNHLEHQLKESKKFNKKIIVTDSVFSMDGDIAPLDGIVALAEKYNAFVMTDDAHATGILGENGAGSGEYFGLSDKIHIQMGTFGKALGTFGAYVAGSKELIELLINKSRPFIYTTAIPPGVLGATLKSIEIVQSDEGKKRREFLLKKATLLRKQLNKVGIDTLGSETQIIPVLIGDEKKTMAITEKLLENNIFIQGIRPPTVPEGKCRLRISLTVETDFNKNF